MHDDDDDEQLHGHFDEELDELLELFPQLELELLGGHPVGVQGLEAARGGDGGSGGGCGELVLEELEGIVVVLLLPGA